MRKRRRTRRFHLILCAVLFLLAVALFRLACGPLPAFSEAAALKRAQRQHGREPVKMAACWEDRNEQLFAVWDGSDIQVYSALWHRLDRKDINYGLSNAAGSKPVVRVYDRCILWRDSRSLGWGCPGMPVEGALPLLVKNDDPAAASGFLTVQGEVNIGGWNAPIDVEYSCAADARRSDPHFFTFWITPEGKPETAERVLNRLMNLGAEVSGITAEAEIVWYDASGNELYRQSFDMMDTDTQGEGSGGDPAAQQ